MSSSAIVMMFIGIIVIWGGLAASIWHAVKSNNRNS